ncbi:aa3-type cytochrome oxidase subunit CtaJ [Salininema proteolyticum]|uniref:Uncharacterized protein n=1 Tax=Salininema proteolyticum TaxID=1607685 RepID=A0ABV8TUC2_9ACTN
MSIFQQVLMFIGIPVLFILVVFAVVYMRNPRSQTQYRAGEDYSYGPVWFIAREGDVDASKPAASEGGPKGGSHGQW